MNIYDLVTFGLQLQHLHSDDVFHLCYVNVRALYGRMNSAYDRCCIRSFQISLICACSSRAPSRSLSMHVCFCLYVPKCVCSLSSTLSLSLSPLCVFLSSLSLFHLINKFNKLIKKSFFWYLAGAMHKLNGKLIQLYVGGVLLTQNEMLQLILWWMEMFYQIDFPLSRSLSIAIFLLSSKRFCIFVFLSFSLNRTQLCFVNVRRQFH